MILLRDVTKDAKIIAVDLATGKLKWERNACRRVSYGTPVMWDTPAGKQIVAPGHGRLIGYDLKTGAEKLVRRRHAVRLLQQPRRRGRASCSSPAGRPAQDKEFKMPTFDDMLKQAGQEKLGYLTREGSEKTMIKGFFENQDANMDGKITRDEWDAHHANSCRDGKNSAFAVKAGGSGRRDANPTSSGRRRKGLPYVPSAIAYRGQYVMVKDGGIVTAFDAKTGKEIYMERAIEARQILCLPGRRQRLHLFHFASTTALSPSCKAGSECAGGGRHQSEARASACRPPPRLPTTPSTSAPPGTCMRSPRKNERAGREANRAISLSPS